MRSGSPICRQIPKMMVISSEDIDKPGCTEKDG